MVQRFNTDCQDIEIVKLDAYEFGGLLVTQGAMMNMGSFSSFFAASVLGWFFSTYLEASSQHSGRRLEQCSVCALAPHGVNAFFALQVTTCAWRSCWKKRFSTRPRATPSARSTAQCKDPQLRSAAQKRPNLQAHQTPPPPASLLCRIHDNEGAAEMLIDTLGPEIVNAEDGKNRWDVYRNKKKTLTGQIRRESTRTAL